MECFPPVESKDEITEKRGSRLVDRSRNELRVQLPPPTKFPSQSFSQQPLPDGELEEVKGFMELGFRFPEDQLSPRLLHLLPGLKRLDWQQGNILELPSLKDVNADLMKERLRLWARSVASMVKC